MNIGDLITELQKFPDLSSVFLQTADGAIVKLDSVHNLWARHEGMRLVETRGEGPEPFEADDFGALLYG